MRVIFLILAFNALFFSVLIFQKKPEATHDNILIAWLIYLAFFTGVFGFFPKILFLDI